MFWNVHNVWSQNQDHSENLQKLIQSVSGWLPPSQSGKHNKQLWHSKLPLSLPTTKIQVTIHIFITNNKIHNADTQPSCHYWQQKYKLQYTYTDPVVWENILRLNKRSDDWVFWSFQRVVLKTITVEFRMKDKLDCSCSYHSIILFLGHLWWCHFCVKPSES